MPKFQIKHPTPDIATRTLAKSIAAEKCCSASPHYIIPNNRSNIARPRDLPALTGLSKTTIWRLERAGNFPQRIQLSIGAVGYLISEIQAWLDSRLRVAEGDQL